MRARLVLTLAVALLAAVVTFVMPLSSLAATLVWDPSRGLVDGYKVYWGTSRNNPSDSIDVGPRAAYHLDNLPLSEGVTYYISVWRIKSEIETRATTP